MEVMKVQLENKILLYVRSAKDRVQNEAKREIPSIVGQSARK